jgi:hypothetical protein
MIVTIHMILTFRASDTVIVYNLQEISLPVRIAKRLRRFTLILEIEELCFAEVEGSRKSTRKKMEMALVAAADRYILVNDILRKEFLSPEKRAIVSYGGYTCPAKIADRFTDGRIHIVYAGVVDQIRGAFKVVECAEHLPEHYMVHVLGFGSEDMLVLLVKKISQINAICGFEKVLYHGVKTGNEFSAFLQSCHIGVNAQTTKHDYERVSFPSKIPSYLAHGLNVVSSRVMSVTESQLSPHVTYFDSNNTRDLAAAIQSVRIASYDDQSEIIKHLDAEFSAAMGRLLK